MFDDLKIAKCGEACHLEYVFESSSCRPELSSGSLLNNYCNNDYLGSSECLGLDSLKCTMLVGNVKKLIEARLYRLNIDPEIADILLMALFDKETALRLLFIDEQDMISSDFDEGFTSSKAVSAHWDICKVWACFANVTVTDKNTLLREVDTYFSERRFKRFLTTVYQHFSII